MFEYDDFFALCNALNVLHMRMHYTVVDHIIAEGAAIVALANIVAEFLLNIEGNWFLVLLEPDRECFGGGTLNRGDID